MTLLLIIAFIVYVIFVLARKKKPDIIQSQFIEGRRQYDLEKKVGFKKYDSTKSKPIISATKSSHKFNDDSIVDVTSESFKINTDSDLIKYVDGVPFWPHHYVYSFAEIFKATAEQKKFYLQFKENFIKGISFDLEGNTNYAFILLFDLLLEYEKHRDINKLENQLHVLGLNYPKTKSYGISFLIEKMEARGDKDGVLRLRPLIIRPVYQNPYRDFDNSNYDYWKLGDKYKSILNLNEDQVLLLNKLWYSKNNFNGIEYCYIEILKLFVNTISNLQDIYIEESTSITQQFLEIADVISRKHFKYRTGSTNYKYSIISVTNDLYLTIIKHCENVVRDFYGHKRKINVDTYYITAEAKFEIESHIVSKLNKIFPQLLSKIARPDKATQIELNAQNTLRWKIEYDNLIKNYRGNPKQFVEEIISLGNLNKKNPSVENIYFEASKFIAQSDKETALTLYIHYLYHDLKSVVFDNRQLTKTIQKNLFKTNEQLRDFEIIVSELIKDRNLEKALQDVQKVYATKRKKLQIDSSSIETVQQQHLQTVEKLNEYLKDDFEDENNSIKTQEINSQEVKIIITQKTIIENNTQNASEILFTSIQKSALDLFIKGTFTIAISDFKEFAKSNGVFSNQLIESINETCYEILDDVLIEEEENYYTINPNYYQKLLYNDRQY